MGWRSRAATLLAAATALLAGCGLGWTNDLVSRDSSGADSANRASSVPVFSPDGTRIAFVTAADDLGPVDTNGQPDVYLRDLATGATTLVSTNAAGTDSGDGAAGNPAFGPDGTRIAYDTTAGGLDPSDANGVTDVYVRDLATGDDTLVSVAAGGGAANGDSWGPAFSPDGSTVAFLSTANDFGPTDSTRPDTDFQTDVYAQDLASGVTTLASVNAAGTDSGNGFSEYDLVRGDHDAATRPVFSPDGARLVFHSEANDLVVGDAPRPAFTGDRDVFVRDLSAGVTTLVSADAAGVGSANGLSMAGAFSPDGRRVVFVSQADDLGPVDSRRAGDVLMQTDVYVRDLATGTTTLVSANAAGTDSGNARADEPVFGPDGTTVAFSSSSTNLGPPDSDQLLPWPLDRSNADVYLRDLASGTTTMVSTNAAGTDSSNGNSMRAAFSADGTKVAFTSAGTDHGPTDTVMCPIPSFPAGTCWDLYVRDLRTGRISLVSANAAGTNGGNRNSAGRGSSFSPVGTRLAYASHANDLGPVDSDRPGHPNEDEDIYVATVAPPP